MKNGESMLKRELLKRKIQEHFGAKPEKKSAIITAKFGDTKTVWRVVREGTSFSVTEVRSVKENFLIEQPTKSTSPGVGREYDPNKPVWAQAQTQVPTTVLPPRKSAIADSPAVQATQSMGPWDPNNPTGNFQRLSKTVGMQKAMLGMPELELKKYFGLSKQSIMKKPPGQVMPLTAPQQESKTIKEASVEFTNMSKTFMDAMSNLGDHNKLSQVLRDLNSKISRVTDSDEKQQIGSMIGALTGAVDVSTAGGGRAQISRTSMSSAQPVTTIPASRQISSSRTHSGKVVKEEEGRKDRLAKKKTNNSPKEKIDSSEIDVDVGDVANANTEDPTPTRKPAAEELVIGKSLAGQTIKSANIELSPQGGALKMQLVSNPNGAEIEWSKSGKVVFSFGGRPYVIRRE